MSNILKGILFSTILFIGFNACSSTENATSSSSGDNSMYPSWYSAKGFSSDSLAFYGYAKAVSSDSVIAVANAELQARVNLESAIADKMEEVRSDMEENGNSLATNTDFILTLRLAHQAVEDAAQKKAGEARSKNGYFTGYTQVTISKKDLSALLKTGFKGRTNYWQALSSMSSYTDLMK